MKKKIKIISNGFERKLEKEINKEIEEQSKNNYELSDAKFFVGQDGWRYAMLIFDFKELVF